MFAIAKAVLSKVVSVSVCFNRSNRKAKTI